MKATAVPQVFRHHPERRDREPRREAVLTGGEKAGPLNG